MYESDEAKELRYETVVNRMFAKHRSRMRWWKRARRFIAMLRRSERLAARERLDLRSYHDWYGNSQWSTPTNTGTTQRGHGRP